MDHYKDLNNKINLSSRFSHPVIFLIYNNTGKDNDDNNNEIKDKNE